MKQIYIDERKAEIGNSGSQTDYFVMIVYDFSIPKEQVRIDVYFFCLMLVIIPPIETSGVFLGFFFVNLRLYILPGVTRIISLNIGFLEFSRNPRHFGQYPGRSWSWSRHWQLHATYKKCHNINGLKLALLELLLTLLFKLAVSSIQYLQAN